MYGQESPLKEVAINRIKFEDTQRNIMCHGLLFVSLDYCVFYMQYLETEFLIVLMPC
jgi:hypothetical protein